MSLMENRLKLIAFNDYNYRLMIFENVFFEGAISKESNEE